MTTKATPRGSPGGPALPREIAANGSEMDDKLRDRARARLRDSSESDPARMGADDVQSLVEELRIHQFELEIQNEELRETQTKLAESRDRYRTLYESAPVGYLTLDADGGIVELNPAAGEILGHDRERLLGVSMAELVAPESLNIYCRHAQAARANGEVQMCELALHKVSGRRWHVQLESATEAAPPGHAFCALIDITARKRAEHKLEQLNAELEQQVVDRTARLRRLAAELTTAEQRERKRLAALLHDDLQQLLVAARMQLGRGRADGDATADGLANADQLLEDALSTGRSLTRQLRPPVLYENGLAAALKALASEAEDRHGLRVAVDVPDEEPALGEDARAFLFESARELLFNVVKYAGVDEAAIELHKDDERLRLVVRDAGSGFDVDAISGKGQGEGFGLFSLRERLMALDGDLAIESAVGRGTCIELEVPMASVEPGEPAARSRRAETEPPVAAEDETDDVRPRVLVVDDHAIVREGIANILHGDERLVVAGEAGDGAEAIEMMERAQPDVVLIDVSMPRMNGFEATREIGRRWPATATIGLSVQRDDATTQSMWDAGAAAFLTKSGNSGEIIDTILEVVKAQRLRSGESDPPADA